MRGAGNFQPSTVSTLISNSTLLGMQPSWATLSRSFCPPADQISVIKATANFIYAISSQAPTGTLQSIFFNKHDLQSTFTANFAATSNVTVPITSDTVNSPFLTSANYQQIVLIHGILMFIAWIAGIIHF